MLQDQIIQIKVPQTNVEKQKLIEFMDYIKFNNSYNIVNSSETAIQMYKVVIENMSEESKRIWNSIIEISAKKLIITKQLEIFVEQLLDKNDEGIVFWSKSAKEKIDPYFLYQAQISAMINCKKEEEDEQIMKLCNPGTGCY